MPVSTVSIPVGQWFTDDSGRWWFDSGSFALDFAYTEVLPDHVLLGYEPERHRDEVAAGMFVGWVHTPAAIEWRFPQGKGTITLTTFRVAPESGPVAGHLLERLISRAAASVAGGGGGWSR